MTACLGLARFRFSSDVAVSGSLSPSRRKVECPFIWSLKTIPYRALLLNEPKKPDTPQALAARAKTLLQTTANTAAAYIAGANVILRQVGIQLVPDDAPPTTEGVTPAGEPGIFEYYYPAGRFGHASDIFVSDNPRDLPKMQDAKGALHLNNVAGDLNIVFANSLKNPQGDSPQGFTVNAPVPAGPDYRRVDYTLARAFPVENWGIQALKAQPIPGSAEYGVIVSDNTVDKTRTLAHEIGHYLGLLHRSSGDDGVDTIPSIGMKVPASDEPVPMNLMETLNRKFPMDVRTELDVAQLYVVRNLTGTGVLP